MKVKIPTGRFSFLNEFASLDGNDGVDVAKKFGVDPETIKKVQQKMTAYNNDGLDADADKLQAGDKKLDKQNDAAKDKANIKNDTDYEDGDEGGDGLKKGTTSVVTSKKDDIAESLNHMRKIAGLSPLDETDETGDVFIVFEDISSPNVLGVFVNSKEARKFLDRAKKAVATMNTSKKPALRAFALATNKA